MYINTQAGVVRKWFNLKRATEAQLAGKEAIAYVRSWHEIDLEADTVALKRQADELGLKVVGLVTHVRSPTSMTPQTVEAIRDLKRRHPKAKYLFTRDPYRLTRAGSGVAFSIKRQLAEAGLALCFANGTLWEGDETDIVGPRTVEVRRTLRDEGRHALVYVRASTAVEADRQLEAARKFTRANDMHISDEIREVGTHKEIRRETICDLFATKRRRPHLSFLVTDSPKSLVDAGDKAGSTIVAAMVETALSYTGIRVVYVRHS